MSQFVVVVPISNEHFATLVSFFMQRVLMKFGKCHIILLDDDTPLK